MILKEENVMDNNGVEPKSTFCPMCGAALEEGQTFCPHCGANLAEQNAAGATQETYATGGFSGETTGNSASKSGLKNIIIIGGVALVVLVLIIFGVSSANAWKKPIKNQVSMMNKRATSVKTILNATDYAPVTNDFYNAYYEMYADYCDMDLDEYYEDKADDIEDAYDYMDDQYGDDWKVTYKIKKKEKLDDDEIDDLQEDWEYFVENYENVDDWYGDDADDDLIEAVEKQVEKLDKKKITKGYKVKVRIKIEGEDDSDSETVEMYVVKLGGKWVSPDGIF